MEIKDYFSREKNIFIFGGSILIGLFLWLNSYLAFGTLDFFDAFPSHESVGSLFILFGFGGIFFKMFNFQYPQWLRDKNDKKALGKVLNSIIKK